MITSRGLGRAGRRAVIASLALLATLSFAATADATPPPELESCFLNQINAARIATGSQEMALSESLSAYGRSHSTVMAEAASLFHSGPAQIEPLLPKEWRAWGENVGYAKGSVSCDWLFEGFWESPSHRAALLNPIFDTIGIGVIVDATDTMWTTHVFVQQPSSAPTAATPPMSDTFKSRLAIEGDRAVSPPSATSALDLSASHPVVAGIESGCGHGCTPHQYYVMFLLLVAVAGSSISWLAFRS